MVTNPNTCSSVINGLVRNVGNWLQIITSRIRRMMESNIFSLVTSAGRRGGTPIQPLMGVPPFFPPHPCQPDGGIPFPAPPLARWGQSLPPPSLRTIFRYPPVQTWDGGTPPSRPGTWTGGGYSQLKQHIGYLLRDGRHMYSTRTSQT